jgi:hypothetical protein
MRMILCLFVLANAACLRKTEFQCADNTACGTSGLCETTGFCSFADPNCTSGRRYDTSAGELASQCTGGGSTTDGGNLDDAMAPGDGAPDGAIPSGCPAGYVDLPGAPGHKYKVVATSANWTAQSDGCKATSSSAYLAVPDTIEELTAMDTIAPGASYWVGIKRAPNGTWLSVLDTPQTFLPWENGTPSTTNNADCVEAIAALHKINNIRCNMSRPAICECNP